MLVVAGVLTLVVVVVVVAVGVVDAGAVVAVL